MTEFTSESSSAVLKGQRALVVGGYGGIGTAVCHQLADQGASIVIAGRSEDKAVELAARLRERGAIGSAPTSTLPPTTASARWSARSPTSSTGSTC